jgi:CDP-glucose 4,6-dehydratase
MFHDCYKDKKVFITGHTGFKGSWLTAWLVKLGAKVCGYSKDIPTSPSNFEIQGLASDIDHNLGDIRDRSQLLKTIQSFKPDMVFHLAAQALVRRSYNNPVDTFETNALGTMNLLECISQTPSIRAAVMITSDKAYKNVEWLWGYRENDVLGGDDPYSASKGCAELIINSYVKSFFQDGPFVGITRAGNVIGGGDWAEDRILPDIVRAWSNGDPVVIRNPLATRPWQHVLEPLSGYLWLGAKLLEGDVNAVGEAYNFGPTSIENYSVEDVLNTMVQNWPGKKWETRIEENSFKESALLKLCCDKAYNNLQWKPVLSFEETILYTALWYSKYYEKGTENMKKISLSQIETYVAKAERAGLPWVL